MPISDAHVGKTYPATPPYVVSRAKVAEFANALGSAEAAYFDDDPIAPPTFAAVLASDAWGALFADPELDLQLKRTVHTDQRFLWQRPLQVGDTVVATLSIDKVRTRGNSAFITVSVQLSTTDGDEVCTAVSTLLHTWPEEATS